VTKFRVTYVNGQSDFVEADRVFFEEDDALMLERDGGEDDDSDAMLVLGVAAGQWRSVQEVKGQD
jgi:hypothetical protein